MINYLTKSVSLLWLGYKDKAFFLVLTFIFACVVGIMFEKYQLPLPIKGSDYRWIDYYVHNISQVIKIVLIGFFTYGLYSFGMIFLNGVIVGMGIETLIQNNQSYLILRILPHASFEIPAILLSAIIPFILWKIIWNIKKKENLYKYLKYELLSIFIIVNLLLLIGAILESHIARFN